MDLQIKGKKAIMAGGSAGMGRATAERLAEAGAELVITARREERLMNAAKEISEQYGTKVTPIVADSSKEEGRQALFEACPDPDILAITIKPPAPNGDFLKVTPEMWRDSVETALRMNPKDPMALAMRAIACISPAAARHKIPDPGIVKQTATDLDQAIELEPRSDFIFATRARFRALITRDAEGALSDARRARQLGPSFIQGHISYGLANLLRGNLEKAREIFDDVLARGSDDPYLAQSCWYHAISCYLLDEYEASLGSIEKALQLLPRQWSFYTLQAMCYRGAGDNENADAAEAMAERYPKLASVMAQKPPLPDCYEDFVNQFKPSD